MITTVEVRNERGVLLSLSVQDPSSGFIVEGIDGLDPVRAVLVSSSFAQLDGAQYQSSSREARNIILKLRLEPDWVSTSVQGLRSQLYQFFMPKSRVELRFVSVGMPTVSIFGRIESFESFLFSKDPAIAISVLCFDPDFKSLDLNTVSSTTTSGTTETEIVYDGTVETGVLFEMTVDRSISEFAIRNRTPDNVVRTLEFAKAMVSGNTIAINTVPGDKSVMMTANSEDESVLYAVSPYSAWVELYPGSNFIRVSSAGAAIDYDISYTERYGGL